MSNTHFQFKKFIIQQEKSAMKVSTLACLFGAKIIAKEPENILDVGAGTGLLTLMLAQKYQNAKIDAIEIDNDAYEETVKNIERSSWSKRITVIKNDFLLHSFVKKYDLIVSNPPFYSNHLKSVNHSINMARHNDTLPINQLIKKVVTVMD